MLSRRLVAAVTGARRAMPSLGLVATLAIAALGQPAPTRAADDPEPAARLQVVVKQVTVRDDRDLIGSGEIRLWVAVWRCNDGIAPPCFNVEAPDVYYGMNETIAGTAGPVGMAEIPFSAATGQTVALDRVVPGPDDGEWSVTAPEEPGFAVYAGQHYVVKFEVWEEDEFFVPRRGLGNEMGAVFSVLDAEHDWGVGTFTSQGYIERDNRVGDFDITFEVRRASPA